VIYLRSGVCVNSPLAPPIGSGPLSLKILGDLLAFLILSSADFHDTR